MNEQKQLQKMHKGEYHYQCMPAYVAHTNYNTHLLTTKKTHTKTKSQPFGKWRFRAKQVRRIHGPKAEKSNTKRATGQTEEQKRRSI